MIANLRRLILLAMMATAFHHPRPAAANSVKVRGAGEREEIIVAPTPPPASTDNAPPTHPPATGSAVTQTAESDFATDLEGTHATKRVAAQASSVTRPFSPPPHPLPSPPPPKQPQKGGQKERDARADAGLRGSDALATMCRWTGSDWQPLQPSDLPLAENNPPGQKSAAAEETTTLDFDFSKPSLPRLSSALSSVPPPQAPPPATRLPSRKGDKGLAAADVTGAPPNGRPGTLASSSSISESNGRDTHANGKFITPRHNTNTTIFISILNYSFNFPNFDNLS